MVLASKLKDTLKKRTEDLTKRVFDKLTVIEFAGYKKRKEGSRSDAQWLCRCKCGNFLFVVADHLKTGNTKSCGCLKHLIGKNSYRFVDLITEILPNKITAIKYLYSNSHKKSVWLFRCHCGKEFEAIGNNIKEGTTTSCGCLNHRLGKDNSNYNPDLTDKEREVKRNTPENTIWRKSVYERDDYACQKCGKKGIYLEAHHKENWADNPELRYVVDNGITLCKECHRTGPNAFHKQYGRYHTTAIQTIKFLSVD